MLSSKPTTLNPGLREIVDKAVEFHGHLGPFLVLGVKMGLLGLKRLNVRKGEERLFITVELRYLTPISCVLDGIQTVTGCTFGNKKLKLLKTSSQKISAKLTLKNSGKWVKITLNPLLFKKLKKELFDKRATKEKVERLSYLIASTSEEELFIVKQNNL